MEFKEFKNNLKQTYTIKIEKNKYKIKSECGQTCMQTSTKCWKF